MPNKLVFSLLICIALLITLSIVSLHSGTYRFDSASIGEVIWERLKGNLIHPTDHYILFDIRLPRIIMAILIGSALAVSGTALQGLFRNPLATPSLIGVTAGASLFAAVAIVLGKTLRAALPDFMHYSLISIMAFLGAMLTMVFVYRMSTHNKKTNVVIMLLSGVAISALSGAITGFLTYLTTNEELRDLTFWTLGSLGGATWSKNVILLIVIIIAYVLLMPKGRALNALMLGEEDASHLGFPVENLKKTIIVLASLLVGVSVAFAGNIGFVGLIVPYILRLLFRANYNFILPLSAIVGSILLLASDTISRTIVAPSEMPIGVLTAFLGAPVFIAILIKFKKSL